jgi:hypothetical protein
VGDEQWDIVTFEVGGSQERLTDTPTDEVGPAYAPDGAIAWFGEGDPCCLTLLEPGGEPRQLPGVAPVWSPDGMLIATDTPSADGVVTIVDRASDIVATIEQADWPPSWQRLAP